MGVTLNIGSFQAFLAMFGPLLVAAITGLKTSSAVKATLALAVVAIIVAFQVIMSGGITSNIFGNIMTVALIFQMTYLLLWKNTPVAKYLQEKFPIKLGEPETVTDEIPVQTDNSTRPEDGLQDVSQDPNVTYDETGNVVQ